MKLEFIHIVKKVKRIRLEIKNGKVYVTTPPGHNPELIIEKHRLWIEKKFKKIEKGKEILNQVSLEHRDKEVFKNLIEFFIEKHKRELNVFIRKVLFRSMRSRWGSCSRDGNISINTKAIYMPTKLLEFLTYHEAAHLIEFNHSKKFWRIIENKFPDYKKMNIMLKLWWLKDTNI